jgi:hypothetical protein
VFGRDRGAGCLHVAHRETKLLPQKPKALSARKHFVVGSCPAAYLNESEAPEPPPCSDFVTRSYSFLGGKTRFSALRRLIQRFFFSAPEAEKKLSSEYFVSAIKLISIDVLLRRQLDGQTIDFRGRR